MIDIYTDGACSGNPGPGGWAAIVFEGGEKRVLQGGEDRTTNNRMEMLAAIEGLRATPPSSDVVVHTDSSYLVNTMTKGWKRRANQDLWAALDTQVTSRRVRWEWVRGHSGHALNEEADSIAFRESQARAGRGRTIRSDPPADTVGPSDAAAVALTHVDESGRASMVDVGEKRPTRRVAVAEGRVTMQSQTLLMVEQNAIKKGDVLAVARVAAIMAAKRTPELVPLCHILPLESIAVDLTTELADSAVRIRAEVATTAKTGVEMEALTAVSAAALTVYDMCKAVDRTMRIEGVRLVSKTGGRSSTTEGGRLE